jgi:hypothetical protein
MSTYLTDGRKRKTGDHRKDWLVSRILMFMARHFREA